MRVKYISLDRIAPTVEFRYRREGASALLKQSVETVGVLLPLWGVEGEGIVLLDGFRRLEAAHRVGRQTVPVQLFPPEQLEEAYLRALHLNLTTGGLSTLERLRALNIGQEKFPARLPEILALLEYRHIPVVSELSRKVAGLPDWLQDYFHHLNVSIRILQKLLHFLLPDYVSWFRTGEALHFKGAELVALLEQVRDVTLRDALSPQVLWEKLGVEEVLHSARTPQQKVQEIKKRVEKARFPLLNQINLRVQERAAELEREFRGKLQISWDRRLENPQIMLNLRLKEGEEEIVGRLVRSETVGKLKKIMEAINQLPEETDDEH